MSYSLYTQAEIPSAVKLREMLRSIGGIHRVVEDELTRLWISWLLSSSDVFTQGGHSILYIKMLADMELAIKVGLIHPTKIKVQQYAARLGWGLPVYSYFREVEKTVLGSIEKELCPVCGPKWRAAAFWEEPGCWCTTPKSVLVMPLAQDLTSPITMQDREVQAMLDRIADCAIHRWDFLPEIKTLMEYRGRPVFVDFGAAEAFDESRF